MNRRFETREYFGDLEIRHPATIVNSGFIQLSQRGLRITNAIDMRFPTGALHRAYEVLTQLFRSLFITPVPDPDDVANTPLTVSRVEDAHICCFVPDVNLLAPTPMQISRL